ncbi:hypothetical protein [Photobacterium atrarenae]|uniref:Uncharacterized protein n=1 Tax=Photobacterium atrarenae TaxID=865757 RepID=A0ABY5GE41_9GAMM|nr:hypothetical protein [Photobacterium atrarenae]UTV27515.1 hypothetical protein NNL38_14560 [Photobacterium atrarenae]
MRRMIHIKGNSEIGYTVSVEFEKDVTSKRNQNASAQNIDLLVAQQKKAAKRLLDKEFPEAATI